MTEPKIDYAAFWNPADVSEARLYVCGSLPAEDFEANADRDAAVYLPFLPDPPGVVLEYGCGIGRLARRIAPLCKKFIACDVSPAMLAFAEEYLEGISNVELKWYGGRDLGRRRNSLDFIYSCTVIQHLAADDVLSIAKAMKRALKVGGRLLLDFPVYGAGIFAQYRHNRFGPGQTPWGEEDPAESFHAVLTYTREDVQFVADHAGLKVLDIFDGHPAHIYHLLHAEKG